jgi:hypothetical protein
MSPLFSYEVAIEVLEKFITTILKSPLSLQQYTAYQKGLIHVQCGTALVFLLTEYPKKVGLQPVKMPRKPSPL